MLEGDVVSAVDAQWHSACFKCTSCGGVLVDSYQEHEGRPYCEQHFAELLAPRC